MEDPKRLEEGFGNGAQSATGPHRRKVEETIADHDDNKLRKGVIMTTSDQPEEQQVLQPLAKQKTRRVAALDVFRGLIVLLAILVEDAAGVVYLRIDRSPWNRCKLANFLFPFFLFIVGAAIALSLKRIPESKAATRKVIRRTLKLLFWGILLQGGHSHEPYEKVYGVDMYHVRWCSIDLQRIALVYLVVALIEALTTKPRASSLKPGHFSIFTAYKWQWVGGFVSLVIYRVMAYSLFVHDLISAAKDGDNRAESYTASYTWCLSPFKPEGLLSSISVIITVTIGIHYGHVLIHFKEHGERLKQWVSMGLVLIALASVLHFTDAIPMNRQLCSFSCVCFTAGAAGIVFSALYILIDVWGYRTTFVFLEWIGVNAMLVIILAPHGIFSGFINGWYFKNEENNLISKS